MKRGKDRMRLARLHSYMGRLPSIEEGFYSASLTPERAIEIAKQVCKYNELSREIIDWISCFDEAKDGEFLPDWFDPENDPDLLLDKMRAKMLADGIYLGEDDPAWSKHRRILTKKECNNILSNMDH